MMPWAPRDILTYLEARGDLWQVRDAHRPLCSKEKLYKGLQHTLPLLEQNGLSKKWKCMLKPLMFSSLLFFTAEGTAGLPGPVKPPPPPRPPRHVKMSLVPQLLRHHQDTLPCPSPHLYSNLQQSQHMSRTLGTTVLKNSGWCVSFFPLP